MILKEVPPQKHSTLSGMKGYFRLIRFRSFPEHLKVTTFRGCSIKSLPLDGFRPFRSDFSRIQNFPNPLTRTSSPEPSVCFMMSSRPSTIWVEFFFGQESAPETVLIKSAFVRVIGGAPGCRLELNSGRAIAEGLRFVNVQNLLNALCFTRPIAAFGDTPWHRCSGVNLPQSRRLSVLRKSLPHF